MVNSSAVLALALHLLFPPFTFVLFLTVVLASFGKSLGIRRLYVRALKRVFEWARRVAMEAHRKKKRTSFTVGGSEDHGSEEEEEEDGGDDDEDDVSYKRERVKHLGKETRHNVISRKDNLILTPENVPAAAADEKRDIPALIMSGRTVSAATFQRGFALEDVLAYIKTGIGSIIEDEVTQRFEAEELKCWNLLTRTSQSFEFVNVKLTVIWMVGCLFRYCVLLPGRFLIFCVGLLWLVICMTFIGTMREGWLKRKLYFYAYTSCFQVLGGALSAVIRYHHKVNRPLNGICVANHTSPIDVLVLSGDNAYDLIGQLHEGLLNFFQAVLSKCSAHIWFERSEAKDRSIVAARLKEHVEDPNKLPILIFPEGTCINNTSVMQFKKGSFEVGGTIYPVAIKYDPLFGDAFWNSSKYGMMRYVLMMMTSWAVVVDVWYLPPMRKSDSETAVTFANRVKAEIARQGGFVDLVWDGNLKRAQVKQEWLKIQQQAFSQRIKVD